MTAPGAVARRVAAELRSSCWETWVNSVLAHPLVPRPLRAALLRRSGLRVDTWNIAPFCHFGGRQVRIGRGTFLSVRCLLDPYAPITIGERVAVAMDVAFVTSRHEMGPSGQRAGAVVAAPITVGDGCWIGARAVILGGVTVGAGCVVAAGAVVTGDCEPDGLYAGVPARRVRDLDRPPAPV